MLNCKKMIKFSTLLWTFTFLSIVDTNAFARLHSACTHGGHISGTNVQMTWIGGISCTHRQLCLDTAEFGFKRDILSSNFSLRFEKPYSLRNLSVYHNHRSKLCKYSNQWRLEVVAPQNHQQWHVSETSTLFTFPMLLVSGVFILDVFKVGIQLQRKHKHRKKRCVCVSHAISRPTSYHATALVEGIFALRNRATDNT